MAYLCRYLPKVQKSNLIAGSFGANHPFCDGSFEGTQICCILNLCEKKINFVKMHLNFGTKFRADVQKIVLNLLRNLAKETLSSRSCGLKSSITVVGGSP